MRFLDTPRSLARVSNRALAVATLVALGLGLGPGLTPAGADPRRPNVEPVAVVPPAAGSVIPGIDARLLGVPLLPGAGPDISAELAAAQTQLSDLHKEQAALTARDAELTAQALQLTAAQQRAAATLEKTQLLVNRVAAAAYRGASDELLAVLPSSDMLELGRRIKLAGQIGTSLREVARDAAAARRRASRAGERTALEASSVEQRLSEIARQIPVVERTVKARSSQAENDLPARKVAGNGIPVAAFDAYLRAERVMAILQPTCGIQWWLIAGIADGESGHGTHAGARADVNGDVFPAILGIPLDGTNHTQAIADTDHGLLDTDLVWDRAVGPLQFTPATWMGWASDGNGDGKQDPQNLYDASLAAARKLCGAAGPDGLHTDDQIAAALKPYAVTDALVRAKLKRAREYEVIGIPAPDATVAGAIAP